MNKERPKDCDCPATYYMRGEHHEACKSLEQFWKNYSEGKAELEII